MGEMWMGIWVFTLISLFIIAVEIYDCFDRKKRNKEIKQVDTVVAICYNQLVESKFAEEGTFWIRKRRKSESTQYML